MNSTSNPKQRWSLALLFVGECLFWLFFLALDEWIFLWILILFPVISFILFYINSHIRRFSTTWDVLLFAFFLPLFGYQISFSISNWSFALQDLFFFFYLIFLLLFLKLKTGKRVILYRNQDNRYLIVLFFFLFAILLSFFATSSNALVNAKDMIQASFYIFGIYLLLSNLLRNKNNILPVCHGFITLGVILSLIGIIQWFNAALLHAVPRGLMMPGAQASIKWPILRVPSLFGHWDSFGEFLLFPLIISFTLGHLRNSSKYTFISIIIGLGLLASAARGALLAAIGGIIIYLLLFRKKRKVIFLIGLIGIVTMIITPFLSQEENQALQNFLYLSGDISQGTVKFRLNSLKLAVDWFFESPVIGKGFGAFRTLAMQISSPSYDLPPDRFPGSIMAIVLGETGLFGTIAFLVLISYVLRKSFKSFKKSSGKDHILIGGLLITSITILIHSIFHGIGLFLRGTGAIDWGVLHMTVIFANLTNKHSQDEECI